MNDKTKTANGAIGLFRATYSFVTDRGDIRNGQIAIEAKDANEARNIAEEKIKTFPIRHPRINSVRPY